MAKKCRSWVEIDRKAILYNIGVFRKNLKKKTKIVAVVKSNAYGHGIIEVAKILNSRTDFFGVDDFTEAQELRKAGIKKPILNFGYTLPIYYKKAASLGISVTISSVEQLKRLEIIKTTGLKIHLKIDTGLHRQGIAPSDLNMALKILKNSNVELEGIYSHFAAAENPLNDAHVKFCQKQIKTFKKVLEKVKKQKFKPIAHMSGSAATFLLKEAEFDMVRAGLSLYGLWPSGEAKEKINSKFILKPALTWKSIIGEVKSVRAGEYVGYDLTEKVKKDSRLGIVPVGYWYGYPWVLHSIGHVVLRGVRCKIIGRVGMGTMIVDVSGARGAREGDEVVLIGKQGKEEVTAEELANLADTINYEIVTRINPTLPRLVV